MNYEYFFNKKNEKKIEKNKEKKLKLAPPWITYFHEISTLFEQDPEIHIVIEDNADNDDDPTIKLYVDSQDKYEALCQLLPTEKMFGNVRALVKLIPANPTKQGDPKDLYEKAFKNNPVFVETITIDDVFQIPLTYVAFQKKVVQFQNDNGADPHGLESTLYQNIAKDVFNPNVGICFCTDSKE